MNDESIGFFTGGASPIAPIRRLDQSAMDGGPAWRRPGDAAAGAYGRD